MNDDLLRLCDLYLREELSADEATTLGDLLDSDKVALEQFSQTCVLDGQLGRSLGAIVATAELESIIDTAVAEAVSNEASTARAEAATRSPSRLETFLRRAGRNPVRPSIAIATITLTAIVLLLAAIPVSNYLWNPESKPAVKYGDVATIVGWHNVVWQGPNRVQQRDLRLQAGDSVTIRAGRVEIAYDVGVRVTLSGPADFTVGFPESLFEESQESIQGLLPANSGYLVEGRLIARVNDHDATSFTIDTPSARIVDVGTEFVLEMDGDGSSDVLVLDGAVECYRRNGEGFSGEPFRLAVGEGLMIPSDRDAVVQRYTVEPQRLAVLRAEGRETQVAFDASKAERVPIANASFEEPTVETSLLKIPGWKREASRGTGIARAGVNAFGDEEIDHSAAAEGDQYLWLEADGGQSQITTAKPVGRVVEGETYQLTIAVGVQNHADKVNPADEAYVELLLSDDEQGETLNLARGLRLTLPPVGTFEDRQLQWTAGELEAGKHLWIRVRSVSNGYGGGDDGFTVDNLRLAVMRGEADE